MKKNDVINYNTVKCHYMINYLLFSNDILKTLEEVKSEVNDILFLDVLNTLRLNLFFKGYYPDKVFKNFEILLDNLENYYENEELIDGVKYIKQNYDEMEKKSGYQIYASEFENKINTINDYKNYDCLIWDTKQIEDLFEFDCGAILSFQVKSDAYLEQFFPNYICNQNYIYFIQKLLMQYPELFLNPLIKQKVVSILEYNKIIVEEMDMNELIEEFSIKNFNLDIKTIKSNYSKYFTKFANFIELSNKLLVRINNLNKNNYDESFSIREFINVYYHTFIEKQFIEKDEIKENPILLGQLYSYIENILVKFNDHKINEKVIDMMATCRDKLPKKAIKNYNEHLLIANSTNINGMGFISYVLNTKLNLLERKKISYDINEYQYYDEANDLLDTLLLDYDVIKSFICDDLEFETLYLNNFIHSDDFVLTVKKILDIYPNLFTEYTIHQRIILVFNEIIKKYKEKELDDKKLYRKNVKTMKKVEKIYYGK